MASVNEWLCKSDLATFATNGLEGICDPKESECTSDRSEPLQKGGRKSWTMVEGEEEKKNDRKEEKKDDNKEKKDDEEKDEKKDEEMKQEEKK
ncbi:hypothetical protein KIN20_037383 [Parelaphostrongylus tenuis]|uniref:Uncharacterized protein n=1 Tax=Parelaphostrongylus tenuis TaxID=148309 RepID=A0AAD5REM2_PARTN|nr:hypothetical protein KIN20_037383 [Parelaphostrongylus tenuis]